MTLNQSYWLLASIILTAFAANSGFAKAYPKNVKMICSNASSLEEGAHSILADVLLFDDETGSENLELYVNGVKKRHYTKVGKRCDRSMRPFCRIQERDLTLAYGPVSLYDLAENPPVIVPGELLLSREGSASAVRIQFKCKVMRF